MKEKVKDAIGSTKCIGRTKLERKIILRHILFTTLIGGAVSICAAVFVFIMLMLIGDLLTPFFYPTSMDIVVRMIISTIVFPFKEPLLLEPGIPILSGLGVGLIAGLRANRNIGLIIRASLAGIISMTTRLFYFKRMPAPSLTELLIIILLSVGIAQMDLGFEILLRGVSTSFKKS